MAAEDALLHSGIVHLLEDAGGLLLIRPDDDSVGARFLDDLELMAEVRVSGHVLLLNDNGVAKAPRGIAQLHDAEAPIAVVDAKNADSLEANFSVDVAGEGEALDAVVLNIGEVPGNECFGN